MKPIQVHKRLYSVLPRGVAASTGSSRAHSTSTSLPSRSFYSGPQPPLSFFDSPPPPPPPSSRPNIGSNLRLIQAKPEAESHSSQNTSHSHHQSAQPHNSSSGPPLYSVALSSSPTSQVYNPSGHIPQIFPYLPFSPPPYFSPSQPSEAQHVDPHADTQHHRYQLDIGAYGIPKNSKLNPILRDWSSPNSRIRNNSVEDGNLAVQVGEDAYFITENAMGVADGVGGWKNRSGAPTKSSQTPSALFATRLMHYCSDEVSSHLSVGTHSACSCHPSSNPDVCAEPGVADGLYSELEDSLSDLEEGIDVLMILEHAYDRAISAHVIPVSSEPKTKASAPDPSTPSPLTNPEQSHRPLLAGSSTALLAILQHQPTIRRPSSPRRNRSSSRSRPSPPDRTSEESRSRVRRDDAVIKIANLGDCMAMLVRGRDIVWRSEEMWWSFNTPVQLGPVSPSRPKDAQVFDLPVQADDILILASDGLSDNLWDEEVLEEVVRIREVLLRYPHPRGAEDSGLGIHLLARRSLAGMLSEALCSRARMVAERGHKTTQNGAAKLFGPTGEECCDEVPFARRAREEGKRFKGGKVDDISVLVAVVSPADSAIRPHP